MLRISEKFIDLSISYWKDLSTAFITLKSHNSLNPEFVPLYLFVCSTEKTSLRQFEIINIKLTRLL